MRHNISWSKSLIEKLKSNGVRLFCVCPGARNAALIDVLSRQKDLEVRAFVDERSAAFFALGRSLEQGGPAVVCTTSGTAVAELLSATIEAWHVNARLVLLTADRPQRFRGRGAPQAIDQLSFLKSYTLSQWDLVDGGTDFELAENGPTQINVCFEEPVLGDPVPLPNRVPESRVGKRPLVLVGSLKEDERHVVKNFLQTRSGYFLAEAHSGLKGFYSGTGMRELPHQFIHAKNFSQWFDSVIRIGGVPILRLWRDLEHALSEVPVISYSKMALSGLGREETKSLPVLELKDLQLPLRESATELDEAQYQWEKKRSQVFAQWPKSELSMVGRLSELLPAKSKVFLGNSLPVREWDLMADKRTDLNVRTQRGVNGIDGLISTFLGRLDSSVENVLLLGDLSMIYDANAFWVWRDTLKESQDFQVKIVVINNGGGRIFRRLFENEALQSPHDFEFSQLSQLFEFEYFRWTDSSQINWQGLPKQCVVELRPNLEESDAAWDMIRE